MMDYVSGSLRASLVTLAICGFAYPFAVTGVGQLLLPDQANRSLEKSADGKILGSRLIGQQWSDPQWFHGRPSVTMDLSDSTKPAPYNAANTAASNLGPTSKALEDRLTGDRKALEEAQPELVGKALPSDVLTASASGIDPDITPANASLQAQRVAKARGLKPEQLATFVNQNITPRSLWIFGEPRVNVLALNRALAQAFPMK